LISVFKKYFIDALLEFVVRTVGNILLEHRLSIKFALKLEENIVLIYIILQKVYVGEGGL
jgi:hypothetical protein